MSLLSECEQNQQPYICMALCKLGFVSLFYTASIWQQMAFHTVRKAENSLPRWTGTQLASFLHHPLPLLGEVSAMPMWLRALSKPDTEPCQWREVRESVLAPVTSTVGTGSHLQTAPASTLQLAAMHCTQQAYLTTSRIPVRFLLDLSLFASSISLPSLILWHVQGLNCSLCHVILLRTAGVLKSLRHGLKYEGNYVWNEWALIPLFEFLCGIFGFNSGLCFSLHVEDVIKDLLPGPFLYQ